MRTSRLGQRLIWLTALAILPLAVMSALALQALLQQQLGQTEQSSVSLARALATSVDNELRLTISALQAFALTGSIDTVAADDAAGSELARAIIGSRPEWRAVSLAKTNGEVLFSSTGRAPRSPGPIADPQSFAEVLETRAPVIGAITVGPSGNFGVAVRVPVMRDGQLRYVLTAVLRPEAVLAVIKRQHVPDDWTVSIFDAQNRRVARSRDSARLLGLPPSQALGGLLMKMGADRQIFGASLTVDGSAVYSAVVRVGDTGWTVALGIPVAYNDNQVRKSALRYGGGLVLSLLLGGGAALIVLRSIGRPMGRLREAALALGRGEAVQPTPSSLVEIEAVSSAMVTAARLRRENQQEREALLESERTARAVAERAEQRLEVLVSASSLLARSLEEDATLAAIGSLIVPSVADVCRIDLLDSDGHLQRKLTHHTDPKRAREIAEFVRTRASSADTPGSFPWVIATGRSHLQNIDDAAAEAFDPGFREFVRLVGLRSVCVVPLVARGRTIGVLAAIGAESGRRLTADDASLVGELAQRAALALDNVRLFSEAKAALQQAQEAGVAKDEFLAMLGHELRNPLAPILAALELMKRRHADTALRERQIIHRQVKHLSRLVDDLLDVARITSGKVELHLEPLDLREVIRRAIELTQPAFEPRSAAAEVTMPAAPVGVMGDALRLAQVFSNLLINATKFSPPDTPISLTMEVLGATARVTVADRGVGIAAQLLPRVFERFVQGDQSLQRAAGGLGLGLPIAKNLVELHGGMVTAESAGAGQGSRFTVTLPLSASPSAVPAGEPAMPLSAASAARVLMVDDNRDAVETLAELLREAGHEVRLAMSGEEALMLLDGYTPDVAVLDIGLPGMDGHALARALRADARTRHIRLIALTGYGRAADRAAAIEAGFDEHLAKPVGIDALLPWVSGAGMRRR